MSGMGLKIGIDIDDVLAESLPLFIHAFNRRFGQAVPLEEAEWEVFERFPWIEEELKREFFRGLNQANFLGKLRIYPDAREALKELASLGHSLFIVTGRWKIHRDVTLQWLRDAGILYLFKQIIHKDQEPVANYKKEKAKELDLHAFIEDELHIACAIAEIPIPVLLFDRPWNQGPLPKNILRLRSWHEALDHITLLDGSTGFRD